MVSSAPRSYFTPAKDPVPIAQEAGWASGPVWTGGKSRPTGIRSPDLPARSSVAIPTELPGPSDTYNTQINKRISTFIKIRPEGAELFHAVGRTDGHK